MAELDARANRPLDSKEAAAVLKMNDRTLVRWARCGYVPAHPLGEGRRRLWRFFENELLEWVERQANSNDVKRTGSTLELATGAHAKENA